MVTMERMLCAKPENHWYFFRSTMGGDGRPETAVICKGNMGWQPQEMETLSLVGDFVEYKGERHFQFRQAKLTLPIDPRGQLHYICCRASGIGAAIEQAIWNARHEDWKNLQRGEIRKMTDSAYDNFREQIDTFETNREQAEIVAWLEQKGCSNSMANAAYQTWKSNTAGVVNTNCYRLAQLPGYSFKTVDENIRHKFNIPDDDPRRIRSAVEYAILQETEDGSTAVECWRHLAACQKLLPNIDNNLIIQQVKEMRENGAIHLFLQQNMMAIKQDFTNESIIYSWLNKITTLPPDEAEIDETILTTGEKFTPDETQLAAVKFAIQHKGAIINGGAGVGKCLGYGTPVLMYDGTVKEVQNIHAGDLLMGPDSKPRHVVSTSRGQEEMFRITPKKGEPFTCNRSHILSVKYTKKVQKQYVTDKNDPFNISVNELLTWPDHKRAEVKIWRTGVEFPSQAVTLDPYFVGIWLGDGNNDSAKISNPDVEIIEYLKVFVKQHGCKLKKVKLPEKACPSWNIVADETHRGKFNRNPVTKAMREMNLLGNKHIPMCYKRNGRAERLALLAGLIDSDGHASNHGVAEISQKSQTLSNDIVFLARSLGFCATISSARKRCVNTGTWGTYSRIIISGDLSEIPTRVERKKFQRRRQTKNVLHTGITIESIGTGDYYGFTLSEPDGLFLLGDFTVTHNTTVIKMIVRGIQAAYPRLSIKLCAPTGKAAARLKEASGIEATTIHVMLCSQGNEIFKAGPLDQCAIIVDESSMVDSALLAEIVKRNPARLILVGDQAQLTPVGRGQPFHDIIDTAPELVRTLTKCYRNTEAVFQAATQIRGGNLPPRHAKSENENWVVVPANNPNETQEVICRWAEDGYLDFEKDIVLCPKNGKKNDDDHFQEATVNSLNEELLQIDRKKRGQSSNEKFLPGDRVINTKNTPDAHVWNGTTGTVHSVTDDGKELFIKLDIPVTEADGKIIETVHFDKEMVKNLFHAYALTVHKSQGSQYRKVVVTILARDAFQLDRSMIYTGVTRTKNECIIVGDYNTLARGIGNVKRKQTVMQCLREIEG